MPSAQGRHCGLTRVCFCGIRTPWRRGCAPCVRQATDARLHRLITTRRGTCDPGSRHSTRNVGSVDERLGHDPERTANGGGQTRCGWCLHRGGGGRGLCAGEPPPGRAFRSGLLDVSARLALDANLHVRFRHRRRSGNWRDSCGRCGGPRHQDCWRQPDWRAEYISMCGLGWKRRGSSGGGGQLLRRDHEQVESSRPALWPRPRCGRHGSRALPAIPIPRRASGRRLPAPAR